MTIYTKSGDQGETSLFAGSRVRKDHPRVEAYGDVDELNAVFGLARAERLPAQVDGLLATVQHQLLVAGSQLATTGSPQASASTIERADVMELERQIDRYDGALPPLKQFILPAGTRAAALLHLARTVCRRAERRVAGLAAIGGEDVPVPLIAYLNRLSDLLFVLARTVNAAAGQADVVWDKPARSRAAEPDSADL